MKSALKLFFVISSLTLLFISCKQQVFTEPQTDSLSYTYGMAFINSSPAGASIYINGRYTGFNTPDTIKWLAEGNATVTLKKSLFWDTTFTITVKRDMPGNIEIDYYANPKMYGKIICTSNPSGASIFLNNKYTGKVTPDTLKRILPNLYTVKFDYPEYRKDSVTLTVMSMRESFADAQLEDTLDIVTYNPKNSEFPAYIVNCMAEDKNGNLWIGTSTKGLIKYDGKRFTQYRTGIYSFIPSDYVSEIKADKDKNLWIGFSNSLIKYNGNTWEKIDTKGKSINSIWINDDNSILAATDGAGLLRYKNGTPDFLTKANSGLPYDKLYSVCRDKNGLIWTALGDYGLGVYNGSSWVRLDSINNRLPYNLCSSLALSLEGNVIAMFYHLVILNGYIQATGPHTLAKFDGTGWVTISSNSSKPIIQQMYYDDKNSLWFALNGIMRLINGNLVPIADIVQKELRVLGAYTNPSKSILNGDKVFIDSKGNLWLLGNSTYGIIKIKERRWTY